jgi:hypothetical protein
VGAVCIVTGSAQEAGVNPVKKRINRHESYLSLTILLVLIAIGTVVFMQQFRFNPAVNPVDAYHPAAAGPGRSPAETAIDALVQLPQNLSPMTPPEIFEPDSLSDKINGKAELYLSAGFRQLQSQRFKDQNTPALWMEVFIYDMGAHENAFAVYSAQMRDDGIPLDISRYAYRTQNALYWVHGHYYGELIASEASPAAITAMQNITEAFNRSRTVQSATIAEPDLFPPGGLNRDSITMIPDDAFGFNKLDRVFVGEYDFEGAGLTAFLSDRQSPAAADRLAADYLAFLTQFGGKDVTPKAELGIHGAIMVEILGAYDIFFSRGDYFAGVHEATDKTRAIRLAAKLAERLKGAGRAK